MEAYSGLTTEEANRRLSIYGKNIIETEEEDTPLKIFLSQFDDPIVWIFSIAAIMSAFLGETLDFIVISSIILFIVVLGFIQEYKAQEALKKLKELSMPHAKVLRDGSLKEIPIEEIVPGDIVFLEAGDIVPADCKVMDSVSFAVDESMLTGESRPVSKSQGDVIYKGTIVVRGNAKAIVEKTGKDTKFGEIAEMLRYESESSIKRKAKEIADIITKFVIIASVASIIIAVIKGYDLFLAISTGISTAIAGIPESLPMTTTVILALGVYQMAKKNAIVRRLSAVEELGLVTTICTDKTGTLTKNEMTVEKIYVNGKVFEVTGKGYSSSGEILLNGVPARDFILGEALTLATLCTNSTVHPKPVGDPTEIALIYAAEKYGIDEKLIKKKYPRISEIPFSSERKFMAVGVIYEGHKIQILKGAPEVILSKCSKIVIDGQIVDIKDYIDEINKVRDEMEGKGLRVLALAYKKEGINDYIFLALFGMEDPPKEGVREAIETAKRAGIRVIMLTGDSPKTARAIGEKVGISGEVITGEELKNLSEEELMNRLKKVSIFARIEPGEKLKIVKLLRKEGEVVAVTGDGVNDAPALKEADVGIAMGKKGTEVSKGAADIVLADDNFSTIVNAIRMGREIFENIRKFTAFLLSWCIAITLLILTGTAILGHKELIFLPLQILLLNIVIEDLPAIALGLEKPVEDLMKKPPRNPKERFVTKRMWFMILAIAFFVSLVSLSFFMHSHLPIDERRTLAFVLFTLFIMFNTLNFKSLDRSTLKTMWKTRPFTVIALLLSLSIALLAIYTPAGKDIFKFTPLTIEEWKIAALAALSIIFYGEAVKEASKVLFNGGTKGI